MKFSMTRQEKGDLSIQVTACTGLNVCVIIFYSNKQIVAGKRAGYECDFLVADRPFRIGNYVSVSF